MNQFTPVVGKLVKASLRTLVLWLPHSLERQLMALTAMCLMVSILGYGAYTAKQQTALARATITAQMAALAKNLATVNAYFMITNDLASIETIAIQTATVPGIFSVLVTDMAGKPLSEVVNQNGQWSPRFNVDKVSLPAENRPTIDIEDQDTNTARRDFLTGKAGKIAAWHPMSSGSPLGWVRVSYRLDSFDQTARDIWAQALLVIALAIVATLSLLAVLLRPPMRALREATQFAAELDQTLGAKLPVSSRAAEIQALGQALNVVSTRLFTQNNDLSNQKFALDQHAIVSITDLNGTITYANQRFCEVSGYAHAELIGQNHRFINSGLHPAAFFASLWDTIARGAVWNGEIRNRRKDGSYYWVAATILPLLGTDGLPQQYIGIRTDITANKALEHSLQQAKTTAEIATVTKSQFLANMSHEIRTPMNAILGMLKLLHNTELTPRQLDYTSKTEGAAKSLLGLLNDILDFSKIDAGKMTLDVQPFRIDRLMQELSVILSANVEQKPVEVLFDIDPATPKVALGDTMRLQQVLINLAGNAIKFTTQGEVLVQIKVLAQTAAGTTLRFAVCDSGIGIAPENQQHIFDGFSQAEASTTRRFGGTGLGLSICKQLVHMMGGDLAVDSQPGLGSTFHFTVTLAAARALPADLMDTDRAPTRLAGPLRVLVVDDNAHARNIMTAMAQSWGWQVDVASDGAQALALVSACAQADQPGYQAIFVDWEMPGMDGWETCLRIRQIVRAQTMPLIVMVTAHGREMLSLRTPQEQSQVNGFLVKPITASMLFDAVADARAAQSPTRAPPAAMKVQTDKLTGMRLLLVEDNLINQQVAQELLSAQGALVTLAANGQLGVEAVAHAQPMFDAVLMDLQMPIMDGYSATRKIRTELGMTELPIIAMTANAMASDRDACLAAGMNEHVGKPFDLKHLIDVLLKLTRVQPLAAASPAATTLMPEPQAEVDVDSALERLGHNTSLYASILVAYLEEIATMPDQLDRSLLAGDLVGATRLLHTLKGLSATVGANHLAEVAKQLEGALKTADASLAYDALRATLRAAVLRAGQTMGDIATRFTEASQRPSPVGPDAGLDHAARRPDLTELRELLNNSDLRALEVHAKLRQALGHSAPLAWQELDSAMAAFDFTRGMICCDQLLKQLESTHTLSDITL
jgi:PAS domain S-box-containing protein